MQVTLVQFSLRHTGERLQKNVSEWHKMVEGDLTC
jgi:hypothetical protein